MTRIRVTDSSSVHYDETYEEIPRDHPKVQVHPQDSWRNHWEVFVLAGGTPMGFLESEIERISDG